jgi:hypothetical protein
VIGFVWVAIFFRWYRDDPRTYPGVNQAEKALLPEATDTLAHVARVPWERLLTSKAVWLLSIQYFCLGYGWEFYISWLPTYLIRARHVSLQTASVLSGLPLFMGALACGASAVLYPRLVNWFSSRQRTWRAMAYLGFSGAALFLLLSINIAQPIGAVVCMALSSFANDLTMPGNVGRRDGGGRTLRRYHLSFHEHVELHLRERSGRAHGLHHSLDQWELAGGYLQLCGSLHG